MDMRYLKIPAIACVLLLMTADFAYSQVRPERTFYLMPQIGLTDYVGDLNGDWLVNFDSEIPYYAGLELGYQITPSFSISGSAAQVNVPGALPADKYPDPNDESERYVANLMLRWTGMSTSRISPYLEAGLVGVSGRPEEAGKTGGVTDPLAGENAAFGLGIAGGLGLDFVLSPRISLLLGLRVNQVVPDEVVDARDTKDEGRFDLINVTPLLGLKFSFKSAFVPAAISALECPTTLVAGQAGTFTARSNVGQATEPVTFTWDFGDGSRATGQTSTHTFNTAGSYTVRFSAMNDGRGDTRTCVVNVTAAPVRAEITSMTANPMTFEVCAPVTVNFNANVRGDTPIEHRWDFGDGSTGTGASPSHTYSEPGTYTVTLTSSNATGTDTRSLTITAEECRAGICFEVTEMNSVFFASNSSTLTNEARAALRENLEILRECPNLCVRVVGYAGPGERNPQQLSDDRARAVAQFYQDNGIAASRIVTEGRGLVGGTTSKKEGTAQFRRADTIPVQCVDLR